MTSISSIILFASAGGFPIFIGGLLSAFIQHRKIPIKNELNHWLVALGGGALLSAISFALIPRALESLKLIEMTSFFLLGTISFMIIDQLLSNSGKSYSQVLSMMMDSIPEAIALGASFAHDHTLGILLALFIGLQNFPEGFNSYNELNKQLSKSKTLFVLFTMTFMDISAALLGNAFLVNKAKIIASIMSVAAGGILYLIFQDIAPQSKQKRKGFPATGASLGFLLGLLGEQLIK
ncbi:ZIP family metal transporter [Spirochaeta cellobiosiphila]|uniref:ZIP family metal transporter n=1 Tax=Spirochaeta cellobiosiphila TaxID=504483 RepID=UPI0004054D79|nr:hypothetical protein [Spirochaeta cellobiosiphila]